MKKRSYKRIIAEALALSMCIGSFQQGYVPLYAAEKTGNEVISWDFEDSLSDWKISDWGDPDMNTGLELAQQSGKLGMVLDFSKNMGDWVQVGIENDQFSNSNFDGANTLSFDFYYQADKKTTGDLAIKVAAQDNKEWGNIIQGSDSIDITNNKDLVIEPMEDGFYKVTLKFNLDKTKLNDQVGIGKLVLLLVGRNTDYNGEVYFDNVSISKSDNSSENTESKKEYDFEDDTTQGWGVSDWGNKEEIKISNELKRLKAELDFSSEIGSGWAEAGIEQFELDDVDFAGADSLSFDFYYKEDFKTAGNLTIKADAEIEENGKDTGIIKDDCLAITDNSDLPTENLEDGWVKKTVKFHWDEKKGSSIPAKRLVLLLVGRNTDYKGAVYLDNIKIAKESEDDKGYVDSTVKVETKTVVNGTDTVLTVNGENYHYTDTVKLVDEKADENTVALYQYLKVIGESSSVLYGHMEDTVLKAGSSNLSYSDTEDVTGSISAIDGLDCGGLFSGFASKFIERYPEEAESLGIVNNDATAEDDIKAAAAFSNKSIEAGAIITLSSHMPNFAYAEKKENVDTIEKNYDKFDYSKADSYNLTGDCMNNLLPGGKFHEAYISYLDLIAEYASQVDGTILFRPLHENTGGWFWWGSTFCTKDTYKSVFKYTVDYLRDEKGVHNFLYLYGPGSEAASEAEYEERYPGDEYVDMVGFDSYDNNPSESDTYTFQENFKNTIRLTDSFAKKHNKLFAITETGISTDGGKALLLTGNGRKNWYHEILEIAADKEFNCCYFMLWSNYSSSGSYYTPFVVKQNENGTLKGHEMLDSFLTFYNDEKSIFASDQKQIMDNLSLVKKPIATERKLDGYIIEPVSTNRILDEIKVTARLNMTTEKDISIQISGNDKNRKLTVEKDATGKEYSAVIKKEDLDAIGETLQGKITLYADTTILQEINVIFNIKEKELLPEQVDDFETYGGLTNLLVNKWSTNKDSGCTIDLSLVTEPHLEGNHALKFVYNETKSGWGGATISKEADWSEYNALRFLVKPDGKNQKTVIQINAGNGSYEAYLNLYDAYANAKTPLLVTLPFSEFKEKSDGTALGGEALKNISQFGLWVNAIGDSDAFLESSTVSGELYYDDIRAVAMTGTEPIFEEIKQDISQTEIAKEWTFDDGIGNWENAKWDYQYDGEPASVAAENKMMKVTVDYSKNKDMSWSQLGVREWGEYALKDVNKTTFDFYYDPAKLDGNFKFKETIQSENGNKTAVETDITMDKDSAIAVENGLHKVSLELNFDPITEESCCNVVLCIVGDSTSYKGDLYIDNIKMIRSNASQEDDYSREVILNGSDLTGNLETKDGTLITYKEDGTKTDPLELTKNIKLVDKDASDNTKAIYAYLQAVGNLESVIFGHQNDTWHKAGSSKLSDSDTRDITDSISGVVGLDVLSLTGAEYSASKYNDSVSDQEKVPETIEGNVLAAAKLTNKNIEEGAIITLSAHMPNFTEVKLREDYDEKTEPSYAKYDFTGYTPNVLTGDCMNQILPDGKYNEVYTAYLDMIADYASKVNGTILFRPFHENTGSWFWWGAAFCDAPTYRNVWKYTVDYLRDTKNLHNLLYVYGPGSEAATLEEYGERYPGDAYVDMVGFDMYNNPVTVNESGENMWFREFKKELKLVEEFAKLHNKLIAVTEAGPQNETQPGDNSTALLKKDNPHKEWHNAMLNAVSDSSASYFLVWANFSEKDGFYTPYVKEDRSKENQKILYGHEMLENFYDFYCDGRSVFAKNQKELLSNIDTIGSEIKAETVTEGATGYILSPVSRSRILEPITIKAKINGLSGKENIEFVFHGKEQEVRLEARKEGNYYQADLTKEQLQGLGEYVGTIDLCIDKKVVDTINALFNIQPPKTDPYEIDGFENYMGVDSLLNTAWAVNKATGNVITISLNKEKDKLYEGDYSMKFAYEETSDGWAGATITKEVDWSDCNALQFYTIPDGKNQKVVIQLNAGGKTYEAYLNDYEEYRDKTIPLLVTIPFADFCERDTEGHPKGGLVKDCSSVVSFGLWVNAIADSPAIIDGKVNGTIYYDKITAVKTENEKASFEEVKEKPDTPDKPSDDQNKPSDDQNKPSNGNNNNNSSFGGSSSTGNTANDNKDTNQGSDSTKEPDKETQDNNTVTETKEDGTVIVTVTEKQEDASIKETVTETRKDGTVISKVTETKTDGSIEETKEITVADESAVFLSTVTKDAKNQVNANAVIKTGKTSKDTIRIPELFLKEVAEDTRIGNVVVEVTEVTINSVPSSNKKTEVMVSIPAVDGAEIEKVVLTKDSIKAAKKIGKGLTVTIISNDMILAGDYTVSIPAKQLNKLSDTKEVNVTIDTNTVKSIEDSVQKNIITKAVTSSKAKKKKVCVVSIAANENQNMGMNITIPVTKKTTISAYDKVYIYKYNEKTGKLEETANCKQTVSADGSVKVAATGMAYIISAKKLSGNKVETIKERISVRLQKNVVKAGKKVSIKLSLPDVVSKKKKFGTEKATITYKSNSNIATVSKSGVITAKEKGTVVITTVIKLSSGQKITKKKKLVIK